jgi:hypothetical protein
MAWPFAELLRQHTADLQETFGRRYAGESAAREHLHVVDPGLVQTADVLHPGFGVVLAGHQASTNHEGVRVASLLLQVATQPSQRFHWIGQRDPAVADARDVQ